MAIYKVTNIKSGKTTAHGDLQHLFEKHKLENDTYESFKDELIASERLQTEYNVSITEVDPVNAVVLTQEQIKETSAELKGAKETLQALVLTALSDLDDSTNVNEKVENILTGSKQAPANILKWADKEENKEKYTLNETVRDTLKRIAQERAERRSNATSAAEDED